MRYLMALLILANVMFFAWYPQVKSGPYSTPRLPPLPPRAEQLTLLSERGQPDSDDAAQGEAAGVDATAAQIEAAAAAGASAATGTGPEARPEPPAERPRLCRTIGPYFEQVGAKKAARALEGAKYDVRIRNGNIQAPAGYWVYLPSMEAKQARKIVADLDERGMTDYYIGKDNVISLGIFSARDKAEVRRDLIVKLGYPAMVDQRYRARKVYWLDLEDGDNPLMINPVWGNLLKDDPNIAAQQVSCE